MEYEADKRSYRVLKLFETLQKLGQGAALDRKEFAEEMGVSERSVQRDIRTINEYLSDCGNSSEIVYDRQRNGYRLCREDTCFLDKGEILAICKILIESRTEIAFKPSPSFHDFKRYAKRNRKLYQERTLLLY